MPENDKFPELDDDLQAVKDYIQAKRGLSLEEYRQTTLQRRVYERMQLAGVDSPEAYLNILNQNPEEINLLINAILVQHTMFFRDPPAWEIIQKEILPSILSAKTSGEPVRAWSAGTASGEEAYTISLLLAEAMGTDAFLERAKIYATDVNRQALQIARNGIYQERSVQDIPQPLLEKYFDRKSYGFKFDPSLRRRIIFGSQNLLEDPPLPNIDLIICRNTLIYLNYESHQKILKRFYFSLNQPGYLFLGKSESHRLHDGLYKTISHRYKIFEKKVTGVTPHWSLHA